jgi:protocatechuate 3,4-dioxygenase beta subunit
MAEIRFDRRRFVLNVVTAAGAPSRPRRAALVLARGLPAMTDGPFYPSIAYRARSLDWDADLTTVRGRDPDGQPLPKARGEHLDLHGVVRDGSGRAVDGAGDRDLAMRCVRQLSPSARAPAIASTPAFRASARRAATAAAAIGFRTIRPVPYPGRTPHIHVKLRHPAFGEVTSQLFVVGEPGNAGDFLYRSLARAIARKSRCACSGRPRRRGDVDRRARPARRRLARVGARPSQSASSAPPASRARRSLFQ